MKQIKVKQSIRKGKLVRSYNRVLTTVGDKLFKRDDKGKKKLSNISKTLIGAGSIAGLLTAYKYRRNLFNLANKVGRKVTNLTGDVMAASVTGGAITKEARRKYIKDLSNTPLDKPIKITEAVNTPVTQVRNKSLLSKRVNNARGNLFDSNYDANSDLYLAIKTNKDFSYKGAKDIATKRAVRKALAKRLQQQLGVVNGK